MGKRKRRREVVTVTVEEPAAERHDFTGGYLGHDPNTYLVNVNERTALAIGTVQACVRVLGDAVAGSEVAEWRGTERLPSSRLVRRPMGTMTRRSWLWWVTATLALYNVCHLERAFGEDAEGVAMSLVPLRPGQLAREGGTLRITEADGGSREVDPANIRTIRRTWWPTVAEELGTVLRLARDVFSAAWAASAYTADFWEQGGAPQVVLVTPQKVSDPDAELIAERWVTRRRESPGKPAVLSNGAEAKTLGVDATKSGADRAADHLDSAIARYFGVPAWIVNVPQAAGSLTYSNTESAGLDLVRYTLDGYIGPIADELSDELPADYLEGRRVVIDPSRLTRGTLLERFQAYAIATAGRPWMTPAEVRTELNLPPDRGLDAAGAPAPALESIPARMAARDDAMHRTDAGGELALRADPGGDGRTVEGFAVTYGEPTRPGATRELGPGVREAFAFGSFRGVLAALAGRPVPLIAYHADGSGVVVGAAHELEERPRGLWFRGRLLDTQAARDWAQAIAAGVNGVSIEFAFGETRRAARDLVEHVRVDALGAIAAAYRPAYAGASVSVRQEDRSMERCPVCQAELLPGVGHDCPGAGAETPGASASPSAPAAPAAPPAGVAGGRSEAPMGVTAAEAAAIARRSSEEFFRSWAERAGARGFGLGGPDPFADLREYATLGDLALAAVAEDAPAELRGFAARALASRVIFEQVTTNNTGVTTPGVLGEVRRIIEQARPAVTAFGTAGLGEVGMSVTWPYFSGSLAGLIAAQAAEKDEVASLEVSIDPGTEAIATYAGGSDLSYQLIRRSSPAYVEAYSRIMLAAYAMVTDNAFVDRLIALATGVEDIAGTWATRTEAQIRTALVSASTKVQDATGSPTSFILCAQDVYVKVLSTLVGTNVLELAETPRILYEPNLATGKAIASNSTAAAWHEDGPFQATEEDVLHLGQNRAYWGMGATGVYIPAGVVVVSDTVP